MYICCFCEDENNGNNLIGNVVVCLVCGFKFYIKNIIRYIW